MLGIKIGLKKSFLKECLQNIQNEDFRFKMFGSKVKLRPFEPSTLKTVNVVMVAYKVFYLPISFRKKVVLRGLNRKFVSIIYCVRP